jgi:transposase InsO family protein
MSALCRSFGISRKTGYKWLSRHERDGLEGLGERSRRPLRSPGRTTALLEEQVCRLRREHPAWGGRKLHHRLRALGMEDVPAPSTITGILNRNGLLSPGRRLQREWQRFEETEPNALWQMDFKGHFPLAEGRCHPLTVLDDHSRFNLCLQACADERATTVQDQLTRVFACYGLPGRMLMDNGSPWGSERLHPHTWLTAWLIRLGITVVHGRPYHPQTQGKEERFHRTLDLEILDGHHHSWQTLEHIQREAFDPWREVYNHQRPHEALAHQPPASRYQPSSRRMPPVLPAIHYPRGDEVRKVQGKGRISFRGRELLVSRAFIGDSVALRPTGDGTWDVYYCHQRVGRVDFTPPATRDV